MAKKRNSIEEDSGGPINDLMAILLLFQLLLFIDKNPDPPKQAAPANISLERIRYGQSQKNTKAGVFLHPYPSTNWQVSFAKDNKLIDKIKRPSAPSIIWNQKKQKFTQAKEIQYFSNSKKKDTYGVFEAIGKKDGFQLVLEEEVSEQLNQVCIQFRPKDGLPSHAFHPLFSKKFIKGLDYPVSNVRNLTKTPQNRPCVFPELWKFKGERGKEKWTTLVLCIPLILEKKGKNHYLPHLWGENLIIYKKGRASIDKNKNGYLMPHASLIHQAPTYKQKKATKQQQERKLSPQSEQVLAHLRSAFKIEQWKQDNYENDPKIREHLDNAEVLLIPYVSLEKGKRHLIQTEFYLSLNGEISIKKNPRAKEITKLTGKLRQQVIQSYKKMLTLP